MTASSINRDPKPQKGTVVMFATSNLVRGYGRYSIPWNREYAKYHHYDFVARTQRTDATLSSPAWEKVALLKDILEDDANDGKWVFYLDTDAIFNTDMSIERAILKYGDDDVLVCSDESNSNGTYIANAGTILIRKTPGGKRFINDWWEMHKDPNYQDFAYEQKALHDLIVKRSIDYKIKVVSANAFNSDYRTVHDIMETGGFPPNFILHLMATDNKTREKIFEYRTKMVQP